MFNYQEYERFLKSKEETKMLYGQGEMEVTKEGAKRESNEGRGRFDLLTYESIEALARWYEEGSKKYGDRNWEDGLSVKDCINRMIRHAIKAGNGWTDEDHLAAVMWNAAAAITMIQRRPDCNDHKWIVDDWNKEQDNTYPEPVDENMIPLSSRNRVKAPVVISDDDKLFLLKAIESGGIGDLKTLQEWVNRRL